jgi:flagellar biosynthesis/type III secretory pathway chaperone
MTHKRSEILSSLDRLLEKERSILLSGELGQLQEVLTEKTELIDALRALDAPQPEEVEALREKAQRNQLLFDGALSGIRRVADRLAELRKIQHSFDTYDDAGQRRTIEGTIARKVEKRA